jgi:hypothetical protein
MHLILRHHLVARHLVLRPHPELLAAKHQELVEPLIEVHEDNEAPLDLQVQKVIMVMTVHPDLQDCPDYTVNEAPLDCEETPDLLDLQGHRAQQEPTRQEQTGLLVCDTKRNLRHRNSLPLTELRIPTALGLKRVTLTSTTDSNQLPSKT